MDAFGGISALALLEHDQRPAAVFDCRAGQVVSLCYLNPAFHKLRQQQASIDATQDEAQYATFLAWATSPPSGAPALHHSWQLPWTSFTLQDQWKIVTGAQHFPQDRRSLEDKSNVDTQDLALESLPSAVVSPMVDWTLGEVPDLSDYVQWFKAFDWEQTVLGSISTWSSELRHSVVMIMSTPDPRLILWGPTHIILYNAACAPIIGQKHPGVMGQVASTAFPELWQAIEPIIRTVETGKMVQVERTPFTLFRSGFNEQCFFNFFMQPICGKDGRIAGILDNFTEVTSSVLADRRLSIIMHIGEACAAAENTERMWNTMQAIFADQTDDFSFALLHSITSSESSSSDGQSMSTDSAGHSSDYSASECVLMGSVGVQLPDDNDIARFPLFRDEQTPSGLVAAFQRAWHIRQPVLMTTREGTLPQFLEPPVAGRAGGLPTSQAIVIPVPSFSGSNLVGVIVLGLSAQIPYDDAYQRFVRILSERVAHSVAAMTLPREQRLAQQMADEIALRNASLSEQLLLRTREAEGRESKFSRLYQNAPVGMYLLSHDGIPIYVNDAYSQMTGISRTEEQLDYRALWVSKLMPEDVPHFKSSWEAVVRDKAPYFVEFRMKRPWRTVDEATGMTIEGPTWLRASGFPDIDDEGNVVSITGWCTDISLQKWSESLQQKRLEDALEAKHQSERFIDTVSHEIRNPLSAILLSADGILTTMNELESKESALPPQDLAAMAEYAQTIIFCSQHQKRIVDDILTFSKLDSNLIALVPEVLAPNTLVERISSMFAAELVAGDITFETDVDDETTKSDVVCDGSRLLQILINLVTNAIKFTRERKTRNITLALRISQQPPKTWVSGSQFLPRRTSRPASLFDEDWGAGNELFIQFAVKDTGRGLTQPEMDQLFHRFKQASARTYSQYGGSGLGLFISKELCELHGGQIGVSSTFDEGSVFEFYVKALQHVVTPPGSTFSRRSSLADSKMLMSATSATGENSRAEFSSAPTANRQAQASMSEETSIPVVPLSINDISVLIVEDNVINQRVMATQLRLAGCRVSVANHGGEALAFLRNTAFAEPPPPSPQPLSIILMDVEMPVMDGLTAVRRIRQMQLNGELSGHVPVAAVTANARSTQLSNALDAGMDIVITKPFRMADVIPRIIALVEGRQVPDMDPNLLLPV